MSHSTLITLGMGASDSQESLLLLGFVRQMPQGTLTPARASRGAGQMSRPVNISSSTRHNTSSSRRPRNY